MEDISSGTVVFLSFFKTVDTEVTFHQSSEAQKLGSVDVSQVGNVNVSQLGSVNVSQEGSVNVSLRVA